MGSAVRGIPALLALALCVSPALPAQDRTNDAPRLARSEGFELRFGESFDVLFVTHRSLSTLRDDARLGALLPGCARTMPVSAADSAAAAGRSAFDWSAAPVTDSLVVTLVVIATDPRWVGCKERNLLDRIGAARGLRLSFDSVYRPTRDISRVTLRRGGDPITPLATERAGVTHLTPAGLTTTGAHAVRFSVPLEAFAPDATGGRTDLSLEVWSVRDSVPTIVQLPWAVVADVWEDLAAWRAMRAIATGPAVGKPLFAPPLPQDEELRLAHGRFIEGDLIGATRALDARTRADGLGREGVRNARVQLALTLASVGDSSAARAIMGLIVSDEPCFDLAPDAPAFAARVMTGLRRPETRCTSHSLLRTTVQSALLPGFGRPMGWGRRAVGAMAVGIIGAAAASGIADRNAARELYDQYLEVDWHNTTRAADSTRTLFVSADRKRRASNQAWQVAGIVWIAMGVESVLHEAWLERRLRRVRSYGEGTPGGSRGGASFAARTGGGQFGFSLTFF